MHRTVLTRIALVCLMLVFVCSVAEAAVMKAKLSKVKGDVQVKATAKTPWKKAKNGDSITESGQIKTGPDGEAFVAWGEGNVLKLSPSTQINMTNLSQDASGSQKSNVKLVKGNVVARAGKLGSGSEFNVKTPTAVAGVRGTGFSCSVNAVIVVEGSVSVTAGGVTVDLDAGMMTEISMPGEVPAPPVEAPPAVMQEVQAEFQITIEVSIEFDEEFEGEDMLLDEEELEELEAEFEAQLEEELGMDVDVEFELDEDELDDAFDLVDDALDEAILDDLVEAAEEGLFLPGTGGIQGYVEF